LQLLEQLTTVNAENISFEQFSEQYDRLSPNSHIYVIRNKDTSKILTTGTLLIEHKFIHNLGTIGHIEDIIVDKDCRGFGLGKMMIDYLSQQAHNMGCYKVILNCNQDNVKFYEKCGFEEKEVMMAKYY
jgi:glucosamine-phosphate N-acetyltransferase